MGIRIHDETLNYVLHGIMTIKYNIINILNLIKYLKKKFITL